MTRSMTAFARVEADGVSWEIRSVNQRYLDASFRMPEAFRELEQPLRNQMKNRIHRGKIDASLRVDAASGSGSSPELDRAQLAHLNRLIDHVASASVNLAPINPLELLKWPGVLKEEAADFDAISAHVADLFDQALRRLIENREREGAELARVILERLDALEAIVASVRTIVPAITARLGERLREKVRESYPDVDQGRLEQELVYLAQRADVAEELDRLDAHVAEVRGTLAQDGGIGRRLDFLMQELNREANTLSSKSAAAETSIQAVELKVIIEQMREQVQNIE